MFYEQIFYYVIANSQIKNVYTIFNIILIIQLKYIIVTRLPYTAIAASFLYYFCVDIHNETVDPKQL